jgi:hypothetical protein
MSDYLGRKRSNLKLKNPGKILEIPVELPSTMSHTILLDFLIPPQSNCESEPVKCAEWRKEFHFVLVSQKNYYFLPSFFKSTNFFLKSRDLSKGS